jgi:hypothetical protein
VVSVPARGSFLNEVTGDLGASARSTKLSRRKDASPFARIAFHLDSLAACAKHARARLIAALSRFVLFPVCAHLVDDSARFRRM